MLKRLLLVSLAILLLSGIAFAVTPGGGKSPGRGELVEMPYQSDPPKRFRVVRYLGTQDTDGIAKDSIVVWDTTIDDGVTINTTTTSGDSTVAGILVQAILTQDVVDNTAIQDIGRDNWSWLQTYGLSQVDLSAAAVSAGDAMGTTATAGAGGRYTATTGYGNSNQQGYAGFFFDAAAASATDVECFVKTE